MAEKKRHELREEIDLPEGVTATFAQRGIRFRGPKGENERLINNPILNVEVKGDMVSVFTDKDSKKEKKILNSMVAHFRNMIVGVTRGHMYRLKICSGHFPMNVALKGDEFSVKNFLGEKIPRILKIKKGADVKIDGDMVEVTSVNKEIAGQVAADIEQLCRITNRDRRIFQDGIYFIEKDGKKI
ncbi:50S ribosomal protein L6 [Candidatus Woesearchaeota archaeon]|nr:50S ribosomal protein L6 [Candidatus Woesearchaeota archaeon]